MSFNLIVVNAWTWSAGEEESALPPPECSCGREIYAAFRGFSIWSDGADWWCCWVKEGGSRNEALFLSLPSPSHSLAVRYSSWQAKICFLPPFRPSASWGSTIASSCRRPLPSSQKNDYGIEMKIRSGIHPSPFVFGQCFCTITFAFSPPIGLEFYSVHNWVSMS